MNRVSYAGNQYQSKLTIAINLTEYGHGWVVIDVPTRNRKEILRQLDSELTMYRTSAHWRETIGNKIGDWLKYQTVQDKVD